jgi:hypothetical protein
MKKVFILLLVATGFMQYSTAQDSGAGGGFDKSKLFIGGNLGLAFGYATIVNVSPQVGYHFSPYFAAGVGLNYSYYNYTDYYYNNFKQSYAGMSIFGRVYPLRQFFIQVQPEVNYVWGSETNTAGGQDGPTFKIPSQFVPSLLMGGGAAIPTGGRGAVTFSILYDVIQNIWSPYYHQAVYGVGYNFGF